MNKIAEKLGLPRIQAALHRVEDALLVALLLTIVAMSVAQIVLRNLFEGGIVWGDVLVRILVLWIGLVGAMVASRKGNHISIDAVARFLPEGAKTVISFISELFTAVVCALMFHFSLLFVRMEFYDGGTAFAGIPAWVCEAIIPFAFGVIALRYFISSFINLARILKPAS